MKKLLLMLLVLLISNESHGACFGWGSKKKEEGPLLKIIEDENPKLSFVLTFNNSERPLRAGQISIGEFSAHIAKYYLQLFSEGIPYDPEAGEEDPGPYWIIASCIITYHTFKGAEADREIRSAFIKAFAEALSIEHQEFIDAYNLQVKRHNEGWEEYKRKHPEEFRETGDSKSSSSTGRKVLKGVIKANAVTNAASAANLF